MMNSLARVTATIVIILLSFIFSYNATFAGNNGNQIMFHVKGGTIKYLIIEGTNQNGENVRWVWDTAWRENWQNGANVLTTDNWWWKGTVNLTFYVNNVGEHACTIDNLKVYQDSNYTPVFYYRSGNFCTGDEGSAVILEDHKMMLKYYLSSDDTNSVFDATDGAYNRVECVTAIVEGLSGTKNQFRVGMSCLGAVNDKIKNILEMYGKYVEFSTRSQIDFSIVNNSRQTICWLYISPNTSSDWGQELLGDGVIRPGETYYLSVNPDIYDALALDCENKPIRSGYKFDARSNFMWNIN